MLPDDSGIFQSLDASPTGILGQPDFLGKTALRLRRVALHLFKNP
jgi:hypothetical protein